MHEAVEQRTQHRSDGGAAGFGKPPLLMRPRYGSKRGNSPQVATVAKTDCEARGYNTLSVSHFYSEFIERESIQQKFIWTISFRYPQKQNQIDFLAIREQIQKNLPIFTHSSTDRGRPC